AWAPPHGAFRQGRDDEVHRIGLQDHDAWRESRKARGLFDLREPHGDPLPDRGLFHRRQGEAHPRAVPSWPLADLTSVDDSSPRAVRFQSCHVLCACGAWLIAKADDEWRIKDTGPIGPCLLRPTSDIWHPISHRRLTVSPRGLALAG